MLGIKKIFVFALVLLAAGTGIWLGAPEEVEAACSSSIGCDICRFLPEGDSFCDLTFSNGHCTCAEISGGCLAFGSCYYVNDPKI